MGWIRELFRIETLAMIVLFVLVIYFIVKSKKKKYKFQGLRDTPMRIEKKKKKKKKNKHEERCREIFQDLFGSKFKSCRPDFLKNPATKKNLELDGYCPHIRTKLGKGLAFEYDGKQHAEYVPHFHKKGAKEFVYQAKKDSFKDMKCKQEGILLIRIPHFIVFNDLERYIKNRCRQEGLLK